MDKKDKKFIKKLKRKHNERTALEALAIEQFELQQRILKIERIGERNAKELLEGYMHVFRQNSILG